MEFLGVVLILVMVAAAVWINRQGGIPGMLAKSRALSFQAPVRGPLSGAPSRTSSLSSRPAGNAGNRFSRKDQLADIDAFYGNDLNALQLVVGDLVPELIPAPSMAKTGEAVALRLTKDRPRSDDTLSRIVSGGSHAYLEKEAAVALQKSVLTRTLRDASDAERATLRLADILAVLGRLEAREVTQVRLAIIWNDGKCLLETGVPSFQTADRTVELRAGIKDLVTAHAGDQTSAAERVQQALRKALAPTSSVTPDDRQVLERYLFGGARWFVPEATDLGLLPNGPASPTVLRLGGLEQGGDLLYDRPESLATIAMPGSGKSQVQVIRNLLHYRGGALVLDPKGEIHSTTGSWRNREVGPVQCFAPGEPEISAEFNPLDWIRDDPRHAWDDAERIAELLVVQNPNAKDPYWEKRGLALITTALTHTALAAPPERRNMSDVLLQLYSISDESARHRWAAGLADTGHEQLVLEGMTFRDMPSEQREGVFDNARTQLKVWVSPAIKEISQTTTIDTSALRNGGTLYLCVNDEDIERYATVLRAIIGVSMRELMRSGPDRSAPIVTFFIDEAPRLGRMDIIEKSIDYGRGYGLRLWLFGQNIGQFRQRYPNADGMLSNCMVRCFMNPDEEDAQRLSKLLDQREGLLDGRRKALAEPWELRGPEYADKIIAFIARHDPAKLEKVMPHDDPVCRERMETSVRDAS
ncbi:type IV secretory system conjugative DNA transfer family protein [Rhizobium halophilum]|uniref:type IV secretory system conjugative DNA transfer family protein n=1 Tax=Rhizobium halophilum TaxID=2846852 RepID=UPI001EFD1D02|nr:type IV secretory system conjugative DNA transfer family protein [Rhizobium halophilum]MCF6371253.1 type IV secretory system conjugative DNA transfer family protein [Rhizobium halophilum]